MSKVKPSLLQYYRKSKDTTNVIFFPPPSKRVVYTIMGIAVVLFLFIVALILYTFYAGSKILVLNATIFAPFAVVVTIVFTGALLISHRYFKFWALQNSSAIVIRKKLHHYYKYHWDKNLRKYQAWYYWLIIQHGYANHRLAIIYCVKKNADFLALQRNDSRIVDIDDLNFIQDKRECIIGHEPREK